MSVVNGYELLKEKFRKLYDGELCKIDVTPIYIEIPKFNWSDYTGEPKNHRIAFYAHTWSLSGSYIAVCKELNLYGWSNKDSLEAIDMLIESYIIMYHFLEKRDILHEKLVSLGCTYDSKKELYEAKTPYSIFPIT
jgi:hypothetical protein